MNGNIIKSWTLLRSEGSLNKFDSPRSVLVRDRPQSSYNMESDDYQQLNIPQIFVVAAPQNIQPPAHATPLSSHLPGGAEYLFSQRHPVTGRLNQVQVVVQSPSDRCQPLPHSNIQNPFFYSTVSRLANFPSMGQYHRRCYGMAFIFFLQLIV